LKRLSGEDFAAEICRSWTMKIGVQFKLSSLSVQPPNRKTAAAIKGRRD
jgi:hypothetical protein